MIVPGKPLKECWEIGYSCAICWVHGQICFSSLVLQLSWQNSIRYIDTYLILCLYWILQPFMNFRFGSVSRHQIQASQWAGHLLDRFWAWCLQALSSQRSDQRLSMYACGMCLQLYLSFLDYTQFRVPIVIDHPGYWKKVLHQDNFTELANVPLYLSNCILLLILLQKA